MSYFAAMAKQAGDSKIVGSIDDLCFYKLYGEYCVRRKSSLTPRQFWKDKTFEGSRKSCKRFGEGNILASKLYRATDENTRVYKLFCFLKSKAIALLKQGHTLQQAELVLTDYLVEFGYLADRKIVVDLGVSNIHIPRAPSKNWGLPKVGFTMPAELVGTG
ncbi:MAG: hypothetical protein ACXVBJ_11335 [Flavisolibacter sp.]